jgi:hypothetical protein
MPFDTFRGIDSVPEKDLDNNKPPSGKNYLLLLAIDEYQHFKPLNNCVRDANAVKDILNQKYNYQVYKELYNEEATRVNLDDWMAKAINDIKAEDTLVIYFSGHGTTFNNKGAWVMVDSELGRKNLYYTSDFLRLALDELNHVRNILIISDSCFSDRIINSKVIAESDSGEGIKSRWAIASGRNVVVPDGEPGENSPFASALLEELTNAHKVVNIKSLDFVLAKKTDARFFPLQGDEGIDFEFIPKNFDENLPDVVDLRNAFFDLRFGDCETDFSDNFSADQHFFNLLVIQSNNERAGHLMIAKKLIRAFVQNPNGSPHFDAIKFEFGNLAMPIQKPWDALAKALNVSDLTPPELTKHLAEKIKTKNLILYIELKNAYDVTLINNFWTELNGYLKALPEQQYSSQQYFKLFLFLLDKRAEPNQFGEFPSIANYALGLQLSDIQQLPLNRIVNWKASLKIKPSIFKPPFEKIDFQNLEVHNLFAENLILTVCDLCNLDRNSEQHPYKYIFEQHQTI